VADEIKRMVELLKLSGRRGDHEIVHSIHKSLYREGFPYFLRPDELGGIIKQKVTLERVYDAYIINYVFTTNDGDNKIELIVDTLYEGSHDISGLDTEWKILINKGYFETNIKRPYHHVFAVVSGHRYAVDDEAIITAVVPLIQVIEIGGRNDPEQKILQELFKL